MKIVLMSMPDVAAVIMHESAFHMPNNGIASIGANVDDGHHVTIVDLIRKRRRVGQYVSGILPKIRPDVVGLSPHPVGGSDLDRDGAAHGDLLGLEHARLSADTEA